jgi:antitoxin FitA
MKNFEVSLEDNVAGRLEEAAERLGLSPEAFLRLSAEEKLARLDAEVDAAADYVLRKNEDLYRRLA